MREQSELEQTLGAGHELSLLACNRIVDLLKEQGTLEEAEVYFRVLARDRRGR